MFTPNQIKTTKRSNIFTAQDGGICSNPEFDQFWNRNRFSKHSDTTLHLLGKALSFSFIFSDTPVYSGEHISKTSPCNTVRIGLHDKLLNLTFLFKPSWFADALITLFGYPCYILTHCRNNFSTLFSIQALLTLIIKVYKTISSNMILNKTIPYLVQLLMAFPTFLQPK